MASSTSALEKLDTEMTAKLLIEEIKYIENTAGAFEGLLNDTMPFFLDSALLMERYGRYSIMGSDPAIIIRSKNGITEVTRGSSTAKYDTDPLRVVDAVINEFGRLDGDGFDWLPYAGGAVGYFGYDLNRRIERMPDIAEDIQDIPDIYLGFYTEAIVIDHRDKKTYAISFVPRGSDIALDEAGNRLTRLIDKVLAPNASTQPVNAKVKASSWLSALQQGASHGVAANMTSNFTLDEYCLMIERAKHYIAEGDIFQVNLAQTFMVDLKVDHWTLYRLLREANPAPFGAFLGYGDISILSSSPERFMYVDGRYVETRPIKGTRPRFADPHNDEASIKNLVDSEKDSAEHVMIVDVKRNDLGRVCEVGSVRVPELMVVESYKAVHHLVSTVVGELRESVEMMDLLQASFPGGSISGAPKIRAMEIIEELEPHRRNLYTGSIGYISTHGKMDTNIVIRTITAVRDKGYLQVGGGIVADSDPQAEYQETMDKGRALFNALGLKEDTL